MDDGRRQHVHGKDVLPEPRATGSFNFGKVCTERPREVPFLFATFSLGNAKKK